MQDQFLLRGESHKSTDSVGDPCALYHSGCLGGVILPVPGQRLSEAAIFAMFSFSLPPCLASPRLALPRLPLANPLLYEGVT